MELIIDPADDGVRHINVTQHGKLGKYRKLDMAWEWAPVFSVLGFEYKTLIAPNKYMKYDDEGIVRKLCKLPKADAIALHNSIKDTADTSNVSHFRSIMLSLVWERAMNNSIFKEIIVSIGDTPIYCYSVHTKKLHNITVDIPEALGSNIWYPLVLKEARRAIMENRLPDFDSFKLKANIDHPWWHGLSTCNGDPTEALTELS